MKDDNVVGQLTIKITQGEVELVDGNEHATLLVDTELRFSLCWQNWCALIDLCEVDVMQDDNE